MENTNSFNLFVCLLSKSNILSKDLTSASSLEAMAQEKKKHNYYHKYLYRAVKSICPPPDFFYHCLSHLKFLIFKLILIVEKKKNTQVNTQCSFWIMIQTNLAHVKQKTNLWVQIPPQRRKRLISYQTLLFHMGDTGFK